MEYHVNYLNDIVLIGPYEQELAGTLNALITYIPENGK